MKSIEMSRSMLEQAEQRLKTAGRALKDRNYPYTIRSAQECVELSLKAALRLVGVEYPKQHDVSRVLRNLKSRFPDWFDVEDFAKQSRRLAEKREPAMYGHEINAIPASQLFTRDEAAEALKEAREINGACQKLLRTYG